MRLAQLVSLAWFHSLTREPTLRQFEEDNGLRFVDFEKHGRVDVDADEHDARIVGCSVARIAFLSNRSGSSQIHVMWADTRETLQLTRVDRDPSALKWSPDGTQILFTMNLLDETPILPVKLPQTPRGAELARGAVVVDRLCWGADGTGPTSKSYNHVFVVDSMVGGVPRQITTGHFNHSGA